MQACFVDDDISMYSQPNEMLRFVAVEKINVGIDFQAIVCGFWVTSNSGPWQILI